ncbi:unnamed protein product [Ectocarpus sp. 12 AP-2014]
MPPTDCFDDAGASCASMGCGVPESGLLPTTRSPLHHGTDPDLSAPSPSSSGVAATGLDFSPAMGPTPTVIVTKAKRKLRGSPARGGGCGGGPVSPMAARLSRGFPPSSLRPNPNSFSGVSNPSTPHGGSSYYMTQHDALSPAAAEGEATQQRLGAGGTGGLLDDKDGPPSLARLGSAAPSARVTATAAPTPQSAAGLEAGGGISEASSSCGARQQQQQHKQQVDIKEMMLKAKITSDNIRLLLHAKWCEGGSCRVPGCESARQLVAHMRGCHPTRGAGCSNAKCAQAQKLLRHYAECNHKRALGGRYCLVCSLVARSTATNTNNNHHQTNSKVMLSPTSPNGSPVGRTSPANRRQPLGYLGPGAVPTRRGPSVQQHQDRAAGGKEQGMGAMRLSSPVLISRSKRGGGVAGQPLQPQQQQGAGAMPGSPLQLQQQQCMVMPRGSKFFRSLPKTRRGSWGGYDRTRYLRRTRFDSIPEEVPEEDCDDDDYDQETSSDAGSKSTVGDADSRSKTLLSSISL